jgi:hypothetical protein
LKFVQKNSTGLTTALVFAAGLLLCGYALNSSIGDFINYYYGSWFLAHGQFGSFVYEPYQFNIEISQHYKQPFFANYTPVPPVTCLLLLPFAYTNIYLAKLIFNILSLLFFSFTLQKLLNHLKLKSMWLLWLPLAFLLPLKSNMAQGQLYLLVLALLMQGYLLTQQKKQTTAALCFAAAIALKIFPAIVLLYLLLTKNYRLLLRTALFTLIISALPLLVLQHSVVSDYYIQLMPRLLQGQINDPWATAYQSMAVLLRQLFVFDPLLNPGHYLYMPATFKALSILFTAVFSLAFGFIIYKTDNRWQQFALALFLGTLVSGYGSVYGLLLLMPLFIAYCNQKQGIITVTLLGLICFASLIPSGSALPLQFARLWLMLLLALWLLAQTDKRLLALPAVFFIITGTTYWWAVNTKTQLPRLDNVLTEQKNLLLFDYTRTAEGDRLNYITTKGILIEPFNYPNPLTEDTALRIIDNQLYFQQKQLTCNTARKLKPMRDIVTGDILYLSDADRGVGFYTLRRLKTQ